MKHERFEMQCIKNNYQKCMRISRILKIRDIVSFQFTFMATCTLAPRAIKSFTISMCPYWHATSENKVYFK